MNLLRLAAFSIFLSLTSPCFSQLTSCIDKAVTTSLENVQYGVLDANAKWTNGSILTVRFLGGSSHIHQKIKEYARVWESFANIKFNFISYGNADIRIGFDPSGYWSYAGTHSKNIEQNKQTMNYEGFSESTPEIVLKRTILHEFGHALGLLHEHKSPISRIQWNKPKVYAHYMQLQGWSQQKVDEQVLNRYSVEMSNKEYDPSSIMHYPIDGSLTMDGYSVSWNTELSAGDKKLIGEMYPFYNTPPITSPGVTSSSAAASCQLNNVAITHNLLRNGKYGIGINGNYQIQNAQGKKCKFVAFFYNANGTPLKDFNQQYYSNNGNVVVGEEVTANYASTLFNTQLFIPYEELHLATGNHNLKVIISVFDDQVREIAQAGAAYFTYRNGPVISPIINIQSFDNFNIKVMPKFTIQNARLNQLSLVAHFYFENGTPVTYYDAYGRIQNLAISYNFIPGFDNTTYNYGYYSDLLLNVSYNFFPVLYRSTSYKYYTTIVKDGFQIGTSGWTSFILNR
ncbi:M12 family metallopeptidase [Paraflavitalea sp. CAU 1676]|uniref:M12 family metallopeptidase n=1 Tax=Paraflavitalea sp. CAU 1676 TaxID=3032598 RepID=UPI0023DC8D87|nr:M12 family metallopeptidase [Paraflavitalea sp. CAU 1676]MDF2193439.1 M12 family metallopeptidase [Paraflavitalea sp. CAU 1676]